MTPSPDTVEKEKQSGSCCLKSGKYSKPFICLSNLCINKSSIPYYIHHTYIYVYDLNVADLHVIYCTISMYYMWVLCTVTVLVLHAGSSSRWRDGSDCLTDCHLSLTRRILIYQTVIVSNVCRINFKIKIYILYTSTEYYFNVFFVLFSILCIYYTYIHRITF